MKPSLCLHVGIHKTGSTLLQEKVFPVLPKINFLKKPNFDIIEGEKPTSLSRFMNVSPIVWRELGDRFLDRIRDDNTPNTDVVLSDEHAVEANDPFRIARHIGELKRVAENDYDTRVLVVIRRQDTWLTSAYSQMSNRYDNASQKHFEEWVGEKIRVDKSFFSSVGVRLRYSTLVREIERQIGSSSLEVIPFELLQEDPPTFLEECCKFVGRQVPESLHLTEVNKRSVAAKRWEIRPRKGRYIQLRPGRAFQALLGRSRFRIPDPERKKAIVLTETVSERILGVYAEQNERLDERLGGDVIKPYGYF